MCSFSKPIIGLTAIIKMVVEDIVMVFVLINKYLYVRKQKATGRRFDIMAASSLGLTLALGSSEPLIYAFLCFSAS